MSRFSALRKFLSLTTFAGALFFLSSMNVAKAQQPPKQNDSGQGPYYVQQGPRGVGGFSALRLSDIWGPAKMPPPPKDFGPHFDFPPEPLNGAPLHDPYPN
jgi:hypothetical protein